MRLTLDDLRAFDPSGGRGDRFLCPLDACAVHRKDAAHRTLHIDLSKEVWFCFSCAAGGHLGNGQPRKSDRQRAREAFGL